MSSRLSAMLLGLTLAACGTPETKPENGRPDKPLPETKQDEPREQVLKDERPEDTAEDAKLREALLAGGASAEEIRRLAKSRNPKNIDALARFINDTNHDYALRVETIVALRALHESDPTEYRRIYESVKAALSLEASRGMDPNITPLQRKALIETLRWHGERQYNHARIMMTIAIERSPHDDVKHWCARLLGNYPGSKSAAKALWKAVENDKLSSTIRGACVDSLVGVRGKDLDLERLGLIPIGMPGKVDLRRRVMEAKNKVARLKKGKD